MKEFSFHFLLCCILSKEADERNSDRLIFGIWKNGLVRIWHLLALDTFFQSGVSCQTEQKWKESTSQPWCQSSHLLFTFLFLNVIQYTFPHHQPRISDDYVGPNPSQCSMAQSQTSTFETHNHVRPVPSPWIPLKVGIGQHHPILSETLLAASIAKLHEYRPSSCSIACIRPEWP